MAARNGNGAGKRHPPGRTKLAAALRTLLAEKEFAAVTTAEIAREAGVTEALIYKYFKDKRGLLYEILAEYLEDYVLRAQQDLKGIAGALNKLRKITWSHIDAYANNRVFARILLLEVRQFADYFQSRPYGLVKLYSAILRQIVEEGIAGGEIRADIPAAQVEQCLLGCIEHVCLTGVVLDRPISPDELSETVCAFAFEGIRTP